MNKPTTAETNARPSTDCQQEPFLFQDLGARKVVVDFSGGTLSSDGGVLFLRQIDASLGLTRTLAGCFNDQRDQRFVDHSMAQLLAQRIYAVGLGYEDLNDHTELRRDPLLATACDKPDPPARIAAIRRIEASRWPRPRRSTGWSCPTTRRRSPTSCPTIPPRWKTAC